MCLIAWNWQPHSSTPLLLLANRDEFYGRAALPLHWWSNATLLAGRDIQGGGTWLGLSRSGRLAALTNYRSAVPPRDATPSRGELVTEFLNNDTDAAQFLQGLQSRAGDYNPFNLLVFDGAVLMGLESRHAKVLSLAAGVGAVSNADFQTPWPKLTRLKAGLQSCLDRHATRDTDLLTLLLDRSTPPDALLPDTGVGLPLERVLSSVFVAAPGYGTRASSIIYLHTSNAEFTEHSYDDTGLTGKQHLSFPLISVRHQGSGKP